MFKKALLHATVKEMQICKRLFTKVPHDKLSFQPKENTRTMLELMQYLCIIGTAMPLFWLESNGEDFGSFFKRITANAANLQPGELRDAMDRQIETTKRLLNGLSEEDLLQKTVTFPWGETAPLGEAILQSSVKWLAAYKLQFFFYIKLSTDQNLGTPDAWVITEPKESEAVA